MKGRASVSPVQDPHVQSSLVVKGNQTWCNRKVNLNSTTTGGWANVSSERVRETFYDWRILQRETFFISMLLWEFPTLPTIPLDNPLIEKRDAAALYSFLHSCLARWPPRLYAVHRSAFGKLPLCFQANSWNTFWVSSLVDEKRGSCSVVVFFGANAETWTLSVTLEMVGHGSNVSQE